MIKRTLFVMLGTAFAGTALAQPPVDQDADGRISQAEFLEQSSERFRRLDSDGDGYLSSDEMRQNFGRSRGGRPPGAGPGMRRGPGAMLDHLDEDGDGALSLPEIQAARPGFTAERFGELDQNHDGLITADERPGRGRQF